MSLQSESVNSKDNPLTQFHAIPLPSNIGNYIHALLNKQQFHSVTKGGSVTLRYKKWVPLVIRLCWKDDTKESVTELIVISSEDYKRQYWHGLVTPYFLINKSELPIRENLKWYKWVRTNEVIRLGLHSDSQIASRLWLDSNPHISRHHMELELLQNWDFVIRDLWSTNGTFLNYIDASSTLSDRVSQKSVIERNMEEIAQDPFLSSLWPNLSKWMKQWPVWNCYFVAAINSIKEHPRGVSLLRQMVQPHPQWYRVQFLWINQFTIISNKDIDDMGNNKLHGSLWDHILERAYWRLRHDRYDPMLRWGFHEQIARTHWTLLATNHRWDLVHEWWWMKEVLSDFLGTVLDELRSMDGLYLTQNPRPLSHLRWDELVTASTPSVEHINSKVGGSHIFQRRAFFSLYFPPNSTIYKEAERYLQRNHWSRLTVDMIHDRISTRIWYGDISGDWPSFSIVDINHVPQKFHFNHAYSIGRIDHVSWYVELINPHDTLKERFYLSIANFYKYFNNLTIARLSK